MTYARMMNGSGFSVKRLNLGLTDVLKKCIFLPRMETLHPSNS